MPAVGLAATSEEPRTLPGNDKSFEITYDKLVIAVGAYSQTFGTKGVKEYATFLKETKVNSHYFDSWIPLRKA